MWRQASEHHAGGLIRKIAKLSTPPRDNPSGTANKNGEKAPRRLRPGDSASKLADTTSASALQQPPPSTPFGRLRHGGLELLAAGCGGAGVASRSGAEGHGIDSYQSDSADANTWMSHAHFTAQFLSARQPGRVTAGGRPCRTPGSLRFAMLVREGQREARRRRKATCMCAGGSCKQAPARGPDCKRRQAVAQAEARSRENGR